MQEYFREDSPLYIFSPLKDWKRSLLPYTRISFGDSFPVAKRRNLNSYLSFRLAICWFYN